MTKDRQEITDQIITLIIHSTQDMEDINNLKNRIKDTIYPNSVGAIKAQAHQELLLEIADILGEILGKNPIVFLTESQYEALENKQSGTLYYIIEEEQ